MTVIRTYEDEHDVSSDAHALDVLQVEVDRDGASGADVAALADTILAARNEDYGTGISTARPAVALLTTGSFVTVYALGTAAALRLLPRRTWGRRAAALALVAVLVLLVATGRYLLWPLLATTGALTYLYFRGRRTRGGRWRRTRGRG